MTLALFVLIPKSFAIVSAVAIAGGLYLLFVGTRLLARQRSLLAIPSSKIGSASGGLVEINGKAAGPHTMMAPISGNPCFLYRTTVWQQHRSESQQWRKIAEETLHLPFFIEDATGQLAIHPPGADLDLLREICEEYDAWTFSPAVFAQEEDNSQKQDRKNQERTNKDRKNEDRKKKDDLLPASVLVFLSRHGIAPDHRLRVEECLIKPNDLLFVAGTLMEHPGAQPHPLSQGSDVSSDLLHPDSANHASDHVSDNGLSSDSHNDAPNPLPEPLPVPQVIRLAAGAAASSSSHMSQQGKITAALTLAGIPEAVSWSAAEVPHPNVDVENNAPPATPFAQPDALRQHEVPQNEAAPKGGDANNIPMNDLQTNEVQTNSSETNTIRLDELRVRERHTNAKPSDEKLFNEERSEERSNDGLDRSAPVSLMKGVDDRLFVISFRSQKEICGTLARRSAAMLWGGALITLVGVCTLLAQLALQ